MNSLDMSGIRGFKHEITVHFDMLKLLTFHFQNFELCRLNSLCIVSNMLRNCLRSTSRFANRVLRSANAALQINTRVQLDKI
jgi:hypothetical protein